MKKYFHRSLLVCLILAATQFPLQAQFSHAKLIFDNSPAPWYLAHVADMDGDGDNDLITQHADNTIYLHKNDGQGIFSVGELMAENHIFFGAEDNDGDGDLDLIAKSLAISNIVRLYENNGAGDYSRWLRNFGSEVGQMYHGDMEGDGDKDYLFGAGTGFNSNIFCCETGFGILGEYCVQLANIAFDFTLCGGQFDGDGLPDFCISFKHNETFVWYKSLGNGHFEPRYLSSGFPAMPYTKTKGVCNFDIDGDGDQDFYFWSADIKRIVWRANDGAGNFGPVQLVVDDPNLTNTRLDIHPGDCDGDGDADMLVLTDDKIHLFVNNGPAGFSDQILLANTNADHVYFEDLNGDGFRDVVIGRASEVTWLANDGACHFGPPHYALKSFQSVPESVSVADLDNNGKPDVLLCATADALVGWYPNLGDGRYGSLHAVDALADQALDIFSADLNGDQLPEVLAVKGADAQAGYYANLGNGQFGTFVPFAPADALKGWKIHAADADADGDPDIFISGTLAGTSAIVRILNDGNGQFGAPTPLAPLSPTGYCLREHPDLDRDGDLDLLYLDTATSGLFWQANEGSGNFGTAVPIVKNFVFLNVHTADLNGDLSPDLVASGPDGEIVWFENQQNGQNFVQKNIVLPTFIPYAIAIGDFDGDGHNDIWASPQLVSLSDDAPVLVYQNDGLGDMQLAYTFKNKILGAHVAQVVDVDKDGDLDVLFVSETTGGWHPNRHLTPLISGFCFQDANTNGQYDPGEKPLSGMTLRILPQDLRTFTLEDGLFAFPAVEGSYTISYETQSCWALTTDSTAYHVAFSGPPVSGKNFGFKSSGSGAFVEPHITGDLPICGTIIPIWFSLKNTTCGAASGKLMVVTDSLVTYANAIQPPTAIHGDTLWWHFDSLGALQSMQFLANFQVAAADFAGLSDSIHAFVFLDNPDGTTTLSGQDAYKNTIYCDFGTINNKSVDRDYVDLAFDSRELRYTIRFQNNGQDTVLDLRLRDQLDTNLIWSTFRPLSGSHPYRTSLDLNKGALEFYFPNIRLPNSPTNAPESQGFVSFSFQINPDMTPSMNVVNQAEVYFDDRLPLLTNLVGTYIWKTVSATPEPPFQRKFLRIWPNPTSEVLNVALETPAAPSARLSIVSATGRLMLDNRIETGQQNQAIDTAPLPAGLYFLQLISEGKVLAVVKFVKI